MRLTTATFLNPGLGVWQATDTGACAVTHVFYVADAKGNQLNTLEIRLLMVVGPDGNTMDGTDYATVMAPDGTVLVSGPGNAVNGTRLVLKLAPTPSASPRRRQAPQATGWCMQAGQELRPIGDPLGHKQARHRAGAGRYG